MNNMSPAFTCLRQVASTFPDPSPSDQDPGLLMPGTKTDIRAVNRATRRRAGFRGPAFQHTIPMVPRYMRRRGPKAEGLLLSDLTRRQRKQLAHIRRLGRKRGLL